MKKCILLLMVYALSASCGFSQEQNFFNLTGKSFSAQEIDGAPRTILFMFTTWCPYCRKEFSKLMSNPVAAKDVKFFYVNLGEPQSKIDAYVKEVKAPLSVKEKIIMDNHEYFSSKFQVIGIPTYIFLKDGKVINQENFLDYDTIQDVFDHAQ
jgi:predicted bacteriocin transport accessory protein